MKLALALEEAAGAQALRRCLASSHEVVLLLSADAERERGSGIATLAHERGIEVAPPARVRDPSLAEELRRRGVDVLLNVHSLYLINHAVLAAPAYGAFNLHPGPLPEYAGIDTVSWALFERAAEYGATLHWLAAEIDFGPIAYETRFPIDAGMTAARLMGRSVREGLALIDRLLAQLADDPNAVPRTTQDARRRRYFRKGAPHGGQVDWQQWNAAQIEAFVRACDYEPYASPWGPARAEISGMEVELLRVAPSDDAASDRPGTLGPTTAKGVLVATRDGTIEVLRARVRGQVVAGTQLSNHMRATLAP